MIASESGVECYRGKRLAGLVELLSPWGMAAREASRRRGQDLNTVRQGASPVGAIATSTIRPSARGCQVPERQTLAAQPSAGLIAPPEPPDGSSTTNRRYPESANVANYLSSFIGRLARLATSRILSQRHGMGNCRVRHSYISRVKSVPYTSVVRTSCTTI